MGTGTAADADPDTPQPSSMLSCDTVFPTGYGKTVPNNSIVATQCADTQRFSVPGGLALEGLQVPSADLRGGDCWNSSKADS